MEFPAAYGDVALTIGAYRAPQFGQALLADMQRTLAAYSELRYSEGRYSFPCGSG